MKQLASGASAAGGSPVATKAAIASYFLSDSFMLFFIFIFVNGEGLFDKVGFGLGRAQRDMQVSERLLKKPINKLNK